MGLQFRKGNETPGQIIAIEGAWIEAEECLCPVAEVLQLKDVTVAQKPLGRGHAGLQERLQKHVRVDFDVGGNIEIPSVVDLLCPHTRTQHICRRALTIEATA